MVRASFAWVDDDDVYLLLLHWILLYERGWFHSMLKHKKSAREHCPPASRVPLIKVKLHLGAAHSSCVTCNRYAHCWVGRRKRDTASLLLSALCFLPQQCFNCCAGRAAQQILLWLAQISAICGFRVVILLCRKRFYCEENNCDHYSIWKCFIGCSGKHTQLWFQRWAVLTACRCHWTFI